MDKIKLCKICNEQIIPSESYSFHRLGHLCRQHYILNAAKLNRKYKAQRKASEMMPPLDEIVPTVRYCACCFQPIERGRFCSDNCARNYAVVYGVRLLTAA